MKKQLLYYAFCISVISNTELVRAQDTISRIIPRSVFNSANERSNLTITSARIQQHGKGEVTPIAFKSLRNFETARRELNLDAAVHKDLRLRNKREYERGEIRKPVRINNNVRIDRMVSRKLNDFSFNNNEGVIFKPGGISNVPVAIDKSKTPLTATKWKAFDGQDGDCSADVGLAVSETHAVVTCRLYAGFYDKAGNSVRDLLYIGDLFKDMVPKGFNIDWYYDTRCVFDPYRKRFWIGTLAVNTKTGDEGKRERLFCVAVSKTQNPLDGFFTYWWPSGHDIFDDNDYPSLGIDKKVFTQTNTAVHKGTRYISVCMNNADALAAGIWEEGWRFWGLKNNLNNVEVTGHIQPVVHFGDSPFTYFVGNEGNNVVVWVVKNALRPDQSVSTWVLNFDATPFFAGTPGEQKGSTRKLWYENLSNWIFSACYRNGNITFVMTDGKDWFNDGKKLTSIRLVRVKTGNQLFYDINRVFGKNSSIDDKADVKAWYGFPAVAVNKRGDMVVSYSRTGTGFFPEARYSGWRFDGSDILPGRALKKGEKAYVHSALTEADGWKTLPWNDCSGISVDPADDHSIWVASCYATSAANNNWAI